jgi:NTP pyrophosphatase (non-canonical NTP hydrolase)
MQYPRSLSEEELDAARGKAYCSENVATVVTLLARDINRWAVAKGFWKFVVPLVETDEIHTQVCHDAGIVKMTKLMLVVTELAECAEGLRKPAESGVPPFSNEEEEIADAIIRLLDYAGQYRLRIGEAINAKMAKNEGRPYRHGKEF